MLRSESIFCDRERTIPENAPSDIDSIQKCVSIVLTHVTEVALRRVFPAYRRQQDFKRVWEGFLALLKECSRGAADWSEVLNRFVGQEKVALMTIHKSKGLEFHTVTCLIFLYLKPRRFLY